MINEREDKLLLEIVKIYNNYFNEDIIKKGEKLPKKIKISLEKGKLIDKEWENNDLLSYINDCINSRSLNYKKIKIESITIIITYNICFNKIKNIFF